MSDNYGLMCIYNAEILGINSSQHLKVNFDLNKYKRYQTDELEDQIEKEWLKLTTINNRLFNGNKFRLSSFYFKDGNLKLNIGLTDYKDLCGTNLTKNSKELLIRGFEDHNSVSGYLANALGVGIILMTLDSDVVVIRRSGWTGTAAGLLDRPGGHPEPDRVFQQNGTLKHKATTKENAVLMEIWTSILQEVEDELGIVQSDLGMMQMLGILQNRSLGGLPSMEFIARINLRSKKVVEVYNKGEQPEADESKAIHLINNDVLNDVYTILKKSDSYRGSLSEECYGTNYDFNLAKTFALNPASSDLINTDISVPISAKTLITESSCHLLGALILAAPFIRGLKTI